MLGEGEGVSLVVADAEGEAVASEEGEAERVVALTLADAVAVTLVVAFGCEPPEVRMWLIPHAAAGTITSTARKGHTLFQREGC